MDFLIFSILITQNKNTRSFINLRKTAVLFTLKTIFSDLSHLEEQSENVQQTPMHKKTAKETI